MGNRWKWPQAIQEIYDDTVEELGGPFALERGPGYRAWGCGNLDEAEWCLEHFDEFAGDLSPEECLVVRDSLERLAAIPRRLRLPPPEHARDAERKEAEKWEPVELWD